MDKTQLLETIVKAADDKRAEDIVALDMEGVSLLADYFVIMNGNSERQVQAIVDGVEDAVMAAGGNQPRIEGKKGSRWMLMDFNDIVVHVFVPEEREFYNLEKLWSDAPLVDVQQWVTD
ncbi:MULTISPECIES: ribosome silencing factor [Lacticaseibacillus]|jgi:ribosome-associated protein|uniref:Ribosomal silencing factor RsfS n=2 Tax=Lacticaseibacillus manihotivorans TaxID=88233 RepID=A0A0R1QAH5_9LACO|nr:MULTISPECIES: ribosome silencing factor [Lacticaseibacillus]KRL41606.1 Iojap family protein [Lacticaseibacillus manihotivorans DSM 13343 = JCM 12514]QFQ91573.1 ribosome silencing factor [Lacticaseibacillus manihotivorans]